MPPKRAAKNREDQESEKSSEVKNEISNARSLRTRKPVVYNESELEKDQMEEKKTKVKDVKPARRAPKKKLDTNADEDTVNGTADSVNGGNAKKQLDSTFVVPKVAKKAKKGKATEEGEEPPAKKTKSTGPLNKTETDYSAIDFGSNKTTGDGKEWNFKISSWNVDGLRACLKKDGVKYIEYENPDIICLQETKCSKDKIPAEVELQGYHYYWNSAEKDGYSGVGMLSKIMPLEVSYGIGLEELDKEGRLICAEYEKFFLVNTYVPNAGRGLVTLPKRLEWDIEFRKYIKGLDSKKPVIICGDMNVSHKEIDLANPKTNTKNAGFTKEERQGMTDLLAEGFVDSFRMLYPEKTGAYTFWTYMRNCREKNVGWRLDYFLISERFANRVCDNIIRSEVYGSDHCPVTLLLHV